MVKYEVIGELKMQEADLSTILGRCNIRMPLIPIDPAWTPVGRYCSSGPGGGGGDGGARDVISNGFYARNMNIYQI